MRDKATNNIPLVTRIIRAPRGTAREIVEINDITIPDLWHAAMNLPTPHCDDVLECWHLCQDLLQTLRGEPDWISEE